MSQTQLEYLNDLKQTQGDIEQQIIDEEAEIRAIEERLPQITIREKELEGIIAELVYKRDSLEVLLSEIDKGFDKVQASVKSLYLLILSKSKILKRKHSKFS